MNWKNDEHKRMGEEIIQSLFCELTGLRIAWLSSDKPKKANGKVIYAECSRVQDKYDWCCPYDYTITVYEPNVIHMNEEQLKILLEHEIMHIKYDGDTMGINPHDAEEFTEIIRKYGIDWSVNKNADN